MAARMTKRADGRYTLKVSTPDGPRYVYGKTQAEVRQRADEMRDRLKVGAPVRDATRTLAAWLAEWQETYLKVSDRAASTKIMHAGYCRQWIVPTLGDVPLGKITPADVVRLMQVMQQAGKADSTRRNCYTALRKALDDAVTNGLIASNPTHKISQPRARRAEARFLTPDETIKFLEGTQGLRYAVALRLILGTGLRRGEAFALRWENVDLDRGEAKVTGSLIRLGGSLQMVDTKTEKSRRTVALSDAMVTLLKSHRAEQIAERQAAGNLWGESGYVFVTDIGKPAEPHNLLRAVRIASVKVGLSGVKVHSLRHTYATTALMAGVPIKVVSVNMGHASIQITADTYGHVTDAAARAGAEAVSAALGF